MCIETNSIVIPLPNFTLCPHLLCIPVYLAAMKHKDDPANKYIFIIYLEDTIENAIYADTILVNTNFIPL